MQAKDWSRLFNELSVLVIGSLIGTQIRLSLQSYLHWLLPAPIFSLAAAQFVGCAVMGATVGAQESLVRLHPSTYLLFTTGVAGSTTSFSSWAVQLSEILTEQITKPRFQSIDNRLPVESDAEQVRQYLHDALEDQARSQFGRRLLNPWQITQHLQTINMLSRLAAFTINAIITLSVAQAGFVVGLHVGQAIDRIITIYQTNGDSMALADQRLWQVRQQHQRQKSQRIVGWMFRSIAIMMIFWLLLSVGLHASGQLQSSESECKPHANNLTFKAIEPTVLQTFRPIVLSSRSASNDNSSTIDKLVNDTVDAILSDHLNATTEPIHRPSTSVWSSLMRFADIWIIPNKRMTATFLLAPCGTLLRWRLSVLLNNRLTCFVCLGTFVVNICASLFAFALHLISVDLSEAPSTVISETRHLLPLVWAARDGFCGCLSTVSTFVGELIRLRRSSAYIYGMVSVLGIPAVNIAFLCLYTWIDPQVQSV
jgi:fluoride ion exporter CrcB/FEX